MLSKQYRSQSIQCISSHVLQYLDDTQVECISMGGWGVTCTVYQYQYAGSGGLFMSKINLAGNAIIKIYVIDF